MKRKFVFLWMIAFGLMLGSCTNDKATDETSDQDSAGVTYSYDSTTTEMGFTAYKFTKKAGVNGTFNTIHVTNATPDQYPTEALKGIKFSIPTASVNTNDAGRDAKILKYFFQTIHTDAITGEIEDINEDENTVTLSVNMNGIDHDIVGEYTLNGSDFSFDAEINVEDWEALSGIKALNNECKELHTGDDGVSVLWPNVSIHFKTTLSVSK